MSTPDADPSAPDTVPSGRFVLVARALALVSALASLTGLWFSERTRVRDDLQLAAEAVARPGEVIALRAFYLKDVEAVAGPVLASAATSVHLLDAYERELGRALLHRARGDASLEGSLRIPSNARGGLFLEARATLEERTPLRCKRSLVVSDNAPSLVPRAREVPPLQQLAIGAPRASGPMPDLALVPRVVGGVCVPEQRCRLLVWVGGTGAAVTLRHDASVTLDRVTPQTATPDFVAFELTVHGPEANVVLEARSAGGVVLERSLRLPIGLGEAQIALSRSLLFGAQAISFSLVPAPGRSSGFVDLFTHGRWRASEGFVAHPSATLTLPAEVVGEGLIRLQAHSDRFSGEGAATRLVYVRAPAEPSGVALQQIARALRAVGMDAAPLSQVSSTPDAELAEQAAAFLLAGLESLRVPLPRAVSARPMELRRLSSAQTALRYLVGAVLVVSALMVGTTLMRRGLSAHNQAQTILAQAADAAEALDEAQDGADQDGEGRNIGRPSGVYFVVCLVLAVGLAFLVAALLIVAKPLWF